MDDEQVSCALLKIINLGNRTDFTIESEINNEEVDVESLSDGLDEPAIDSFPNHFLDDVEDRIKSSYGSSHEEMCVAGSYTPLGVKYLN